MKKCKWINYILVIALIVTIFSQQIKINRFDNRIIILENENLELFQLAEQNATLILKLAIHQKRLNIVLENLQNIVKRLQDINEKTIKDLITPTLDTIVEVIGYLIKNQVLLNKYIEKNVDSKPFFAKLKLATVEVKVGRVGGAGTIIKMNNDYLYILTAKHVVDCKGTIEIQATDIKNEKYIRIKDISRDNVYKDKELDMAVIKAPKPEGIFVSLDLAKDRPNIGTKIYTIGHPLSIGYTIQTGIVSNYTKRIFGDNKREYMMISAPAFNGNSGGACVNCFNEVVGIVVGIAYVKEEGLFDDDNFYIPHLVFVVTIDDVNTFMEGLEIETTNSN